MNIFVVIKQWTSWLAIFELCWFFFFKCFFDYFSSFAIVCGEEFWCVNLRGIKKEEEVNRPSLTHRAICMLKCNCENQKNKTHLRLEDTSLMCVHGNIFSFFGFFWKHKCISCVNSAVVSPEIPERNVATKKMRKTYLGYRLWAVPK